MKKIIFSLFFIIVLMQLLAQEEKQFEVADNELFVIPTAYTMPSGKVYFADYELAIINFTAAVSNRSQLSFYSLFPITTDFLETLTLSYKLNWMKKSKFSSALWVNYLPKGNAGFAGNIFSFGNRFRTNFHLGAGFGFEFNNGDENASDLIYLMGAKFPFSNVTSFMVEYFNFSSIVDDDFDGVLNIGFRFKGSKLAFDISGLRPLVSDSGNFLFFPFLKMVVMIN